MIPALEGAKMVVAAVALTVAFALGLWAGQAWSRGRVEAARAAEEVAKRDGAGWETTARLYAKTLAAFRERDKANAAELDRLRRQAAQAAKDRDAEQRAAEVAYANWRASYAAALRSPDCAELMKETTCAAFRSY
jgi:uncharacterized protein HemX